MKPTILLFIALAVIFTLTPTSEAACANQAVYDECKTIGNNQLAACAFDDWICKCNANTALQNCYLQCKDDPNIQTEGEAYKPAVEQSCSLAASQSSAKAQATPVAPQPQPQPQPPTPQPTPPPQPPTTNIAKSAEPTPSTTANSAASNMIAVPLIAAVTIMTFIGQFV